MIQQLFLDPMNRLRTAWRFLIFGLLFLLIVFALQVITALGFVAYLALTDSSFTSGGEQLFTQRFDEIANALSAIAAPPTTLLVTLLIVLCRKYLDRRTIASLGLRRLNWQEINWLPVGFLLGMTPILVGTVCLWTLGEYRFGTWSASATTAILAPTLILMAFVEEIVCRGYLLQNLVDIRRPALGVLFSSLVFWLLHGMNPHAWASPWTSINLFGAGIVLSLAYLASDNLWFPTVLHYAWNFTQGILLSLPISGNKVSGMIGVESTGQVPDWLSGGGFGLEGSVIVTVMEIVLAGVFGYALVIKRRPESIVELSTVVETSTPLDAELLSSTAGLS